MACKIVRDGCRLQVATRVKVMCLLKLCCYLKSFARLTEHQSLFQGNIEIMYRKYSIPIFLLLLCLISLGFRQKRMLTEAEAVQKAEEFIAQQGYTNLPPIKDKSKWAPDAVWGVPSQRVMDNRRNSLEPQAYGVARGKSNDLYAWIVVFRYNPNNPKNQMYFREYPELEKAGHAVTMDAYGRKIQMRHSLVYLEFEGLKKLAQ